MHSLEPKSKIPVLKPEPFKIVRTRILPETIFDYLKNLNRNQNQ